MKEKKILNSIKKAIGEAPIDILDDIKSSPRTKMMRHDHITKQEEKRFNYRSFMPYISIASIFILAVFGWSYETRMVDSQIFLDVNPGVEIVTNRRDKVIDIRWTNEDGRLLVQDYDFKGKEIQQVTEEVLEEMMRKKYLHNDHRFLLLSVYNKNREKADSQRVVLDRSIHEYLESRSVDPIVLSQKLEKTSTIEEYSKKYEVSINKMTFIRNLMILNPDFEIEELVDLKIEELVLLSQDMKLDLTKIIQSSDLDDIQNPKEDEKEGIKLETEKTESEPEKVEKVEEVQVPEKIEEPKKPDNVVPVENKKPVKSDDNHDEEEKSGIISPERARSIALSIANGEIVDFDFDEDDLEYEIEIELGDLEYEIKIDARTGEVLDVDIDD